MEDQRKMFALYPLPPQREICKTENPNNPPDVEKLIAQQENNGCTYKGFVVCVPRDFDGTGGAVALTRWIEKMESVIDNSGCLANQRVKYAMEFVHPLRLSKFGRRLESFNAAILTAGILTDEAVRSGTLAKAGEKRKERDEASKSESVGKDKKKAKGGARCATIAKGRVTWPETVEHRLGMQSRYEHKQSMGRELLWCGDSMSRKTKMLLSTKENETVVKRFPIVMISRTYFPDLRFRTRMGHFAFTVMTFGINNAPETKEDHENHLRFMLDLLRKEKLYAKFSKWSFGCKEVLFLDTCNITRVLAGYYRHFIKNFSKIVKPLTSLTQKNQKATRRLHDSDLVLGAVVYAAKDLVALFVRNKECLSFQYHKSLQHIFDLNVLEYASKEMERSEASTSVSDGCDISVWVKGLILAVKGEALNSACCRMSSSKFIICFTTIVLLPLYFAFAAVDEDLSPLAVRGLHQQ
ncbi:hypothetical protein Tco_0908045, partial [Tanacetum coccineum]